MGDEVETAFIDRFFFSEIWLCSGEEDWISGWKWVWEYVYAYMSVIYNFKR